MSSDENFFSMAMVKMPPLSEVKQHFGFRSGTHYSTIARNPPAALARLLSPGDDAQRIREVMTGLYTLRNRPGELRAFRTRAAQHAAIRRREWRESQAHQAALGRAKERAKRRKDRTYARLLPAARGGYQEARHFSPPVKIGIMQSLHCACTPSYLAFNAACNPSDAIFPGDTTPSTCSVFEQD